MSDGVDWEMAHGICCGDFPDDWDRDDDYVKEEVNIEYISIFIALTPSKFLSDDNILIRHKILNSNNKISSEDFEIYHDKYNQYDKYALEIFYKNSSIGYILKNKSPYSTAKEIDDFSFTNGKINTLKVRYNGENLILSKEKSDRESHKEELTQPKKRTKQEEEEYLHSIYGNSSYKEEEFTQPNKWEKEEELVSDSDYSKIYNLVMNNSSISAKNKQKRITEAYQSLMAINEGNFIYSTIDFFGGNSDKMKEEQKEELFHSLSKFWQLW